MYNNVIVIPSDLFYLGFAYKQHDPPQIATNAAHNIMIPEVSRSVTKCGVWVSDHVVVNGTKHFLAIDVPTSRLRTMSLLSRVNSAYAALDASFRMST